MRKKLIEVALPLDEINEAGAREKSIRHGHPSTLHLWWSRKPLAVARAVIFGQMVDDPSSLPEEFPTAEAQERERERLFQILRELVVWENTTNEKVLENARVEIRRSWRRACADNADHPHAAELFNPEKLPPFHDPFAGGGALPLEAQRLGFEAHASDLNPVAVLINKAMIEIPPKFAGRPPVNPQDRKGMLGHSDWPGATGLAADVRYYGQWMRDEAEKRIGHLYPKVEISQKMAETRPDLTPYVGRELTVIAWLWARTVRSPNPAFADVEVPLVNSFVLSSKKGKEAYVEPVIEGREYRFEVKIGIPSDNVGLRDGTKSAGSGSPFLCLMSKSPIPFEYIRAQGKNGCIGSRMMAIVAEGNRGRVYLSTQTDQELKELESNPEWIPSTDLPERALGFRIQEYGMKQWSDLFSRRQLLALDTFSTLVSEVQKEVCKDALVPGGLEDSTSMAEGGTGSRAYAEAVGVYLGLAASRFTDYLNNLCRWRSDTQSSTSLFGRQAIPMIWDFAERNPFCNRAGSWNVLLNTVVKVVSSGFQSANSNRRCMVYQADAATTHSKLKQVVSTDPPYYDNIGYADLSDFFYVWLRRTQKGTFPELFSTVSVPKAKELIASPYRHGGKEAAGSYFLRGMGKVLRRLTSISHPGIPLSIYYAFKQSESKSKTGTTGTGWETFLEAVIRSGLSITGTWPVRTELGTRMVAMQSSALSSSIVLVCRRRRKDAPITMRGKFLAQLRNALTLAIKDIQSGNIAPVDLAQAAIGPGMAVYTRYVWLVFVWHVVLSTIRIFEQPVSRDYSDFV